MKRITFLPFLLLLITLALGSCEEDNYADWKILNDEWLETHKTDPGFIQTESGLCYKVIHQGEMGKPNINSVITVRYKGSLIDGTVFEKNDRFTKPLSYLMQGWIEGVRKMNVGGKYILYIPSTLGYGKDGSGDIPPHSTLIFVIELLDSKNQL
ncbi:MAG: FKBP-type peptidyl-prolyl cis-trans isomerase [Paludibacter sp.]